MDLPQNVLEEVDRMANQSFAPAKENFWFGTKVGPTEDETEWRNFSLTDKYVFQRWHTSILSGELAFMTVLERGTVIERSSVTDALCGNHHVLVYTFGGAKVRVLVPAEDRLAHALGERILGQFTDPLKKYELQDPLRALELKDPLTE